MLLILLSLVVLVVVVVVEASFSGICAVAPDLEFYVFQVGRFSTPD